MNPHATLISLAFLALAAALRARDADPVTFDTVVSSVPEQKKLYRDNKRVVGTVKIYAIEAKDGGFAATLGGDFDFEEVHDAAGNQRHTVTASRFASRRVNVGFYAAADYTYTVVPDGDRFFVSEFYTRDSSLVRHLKTTQGPACLPSSFNGNLSIEVVAFLLAGNDRVTHTVALGPASRATKFGKEVVAIPATLTPRGEAVAHLGGGVIQQTNYFDPCNAHVFLGSESSDAVPTKARPWAHQTFCTLEYRTRPEGPPVPRRFTRHVQPDGGEKLLEYEVEYTRFEDYTPDPEDFRLETRYGLTTPTSAADGAALVGVRSGGRSRAWPWAASAGGVALLGGRVPGVPPAEGTGRRIKRVSPRSHRQVTKVRLCSQSERRGRVSPATPSHEIRSSPAVSSHVRSHNGWGG